MLGIGGSVARGSSSSSKLPKYSTTSNRGSLDRSKKPWFISLLVAVKVCSSLATFMLLDYLHFITKDYTLSYEQTSNNKDTNLKVKGLLGSWSPLLQTLAFIQLLSGIIYLSVQKPFSKWKKSPISRWHWFRIYRHALISVIFLSAWTYGLVLSGPFRTIFLSSHYDYTVAGILTGLFVTKSGTRLRGGVLFLSGVVILILFDDRSVHFHHHRPTRSTELEEQPFFSDHSLGIMTLLLCLLFKLGFEAFAKNLAGDLGGAKRLHALSTPTSALILISLTLIDLATGGKLISIWSNFFSLLFIILFGFVLNHYVDSICMKRMETHQVARIGTSASHFSALLYSLVWISSNEVPTIATLISFTLCYLGTFSLTSSERASGGGSLVGYSSDGLPLFNFSTSSFSGEVNVPLWKNILRLLFSFYKEIQEDVISRRIFYYFILTVGFSGVEFIYGALTNSLGLVSDGFHMLFDAMAIFIGLCASVMCRWKSTRMFPFGYGRVEVLSGYLNALFLLLVAGAISFEAVGRLVDPPRVDAHRLLPISVVGLFVNLIGIYSFRHGGGSAAHSHPHDNANIRGVFLHVLADTMGSVGVIISSVLIKHFGLLIADPLCSLVIAVLIVLSALPLLKDTARSLLLTVPQGMEKNLQQAVLQILAMEGVKGYRMARFWTHTPSFLTGSIHIQATRDANQQQIIRQVNNLFSSIGFSHFTTQVEKDEFIMRRNQEFSEEDEDLGEIAPRKGVNGMTIVGIGPNVSLNLNSSSTMNQDESNLKRGDKTKVEIDLV